jgi:drug/metabolite transporter superfamily protein YnfA
MRDLPFDYRQRSFERRRGGFPNLRRKTQQPSHFTGSSVSTCDVMDEGKSLTETRRSRKMYSGIVPTFQPAHFGRVYATYGGFFIALSLFWGWFVDRNIPDRFDLIGAAISLAGVAVIMYWPR